MNAQRFQKTSGLILAGLAAVCLTMGSSAKGCSLTNNIAAHSISLPSSALLRSIASPIDAEASQIPDQRGGAPASIQGLWQVTYTSAGQTVDMAFEVFHSDGTEMLNDITPPAEGNVCLGVWTQTAPTTYKLTHPAWVFDANGNLTGTEMFSVTIALNSADKFTGSYTLSSYDSEGNLGPVYTGILAATRIQPNY